MTMRRPPSHRLQRKNETFRPMIKKAGRSHRPAYTLRGRDIGYDVPASFVIGWLQHRNGDAQSG
jgi:hypothetical protein